MSSDSISRIITHLQQNQESILQRYDPFLRFASVSTDPSYRDEVRRCADWLVSEMTRIGLENCRAIDTAGHPVVYGDWLHAGSARPTVLIYAHYDVQPPEPLELWETPPFEPNLRGGKLYARGVLDDKAGVWANLMVIEAMLAIDGKLPVNVKIIFEGEEETASPNMAPFVSANHDLLASDVIALCDGSFDPDRPDISYALRGIVAARVTITGARHDLHSGIYGGAVHNPVHMVGRIIGSFHDQDGRVQIAGFNDRVQPLSESELAQVEESWAAERDGWMRRAGTDRFWGESVASIPVRTTALPTLDIIGVWGGYQGPGIKTIIPGSAGFVATMRLVADQDPFEIGDLFLNHVQGFATGTLDIEAKVVAHGWPVSVDPQSPEIEALQQAMEETLGKRARLSRGGGSVPIAGMFQHELGAPLVPMGLGKGENVHAPNEFMEVDSFFKGMELATRFYFHIGDKGR